MTQTPVLSVREPRDVLAYVPYRLGFQPDDSLVVLSLRGPRRRLGLVVRFDLPEPSAPASHVSVLARTAAAHARRDGATAALVVAYRDHAPAFAQTVLARVRRVLERGGVAVADAWHVGDGRYRSTVCHDPVCCPAAGRPLADLDHSRLGPELVLRGMAVGASRDSLVADLCGPGGPAAATVEAARARRAAAPPPADARARVQRRVEALRRWQRALDAALAADPANGGTGPAPEVDDLACGALIDDLEDVVVRDAVMLTAVPGGSAAAAALVARRADEPVPPSVAATLDAVFGGRTAGGDGSGADAVPGPLPTEGPPAAVVEPDPTRCRAAASLLAGTARRAGPGHRAPAVALLAWLAWFDGDGARARLLCERALQDRTGYSLAELVAVSLDRGLPPAWAAAARDRDLAAELHPRTDRTSAGGAGGHPRRPPVP